MPVFVNDIILYTTEDNDIKLELKVFEDTVWLTQKEIAELFQKADSTIKEHIKNIFEEGECDVASTSRKFRLVQTEGTRDVEREIIVYSLDVILAVGYRVRSHRGTQFRRWATTTLKEYLVKGFVMDDKRLKNPKATDYFEELLERIRDIRSSEKRFYQKVKDIYALSADYDKDNKKTEEFFKKVQNKLLYAVTGNTAAEIIVNRVDHNKPNMGLTSYHGTKVRKQDIMIAKNYLEQLELENLNRIVTMYLDHAEYMAKQQKVLYMSDWEDKLNEFLKFNNHEILQDSGKVSNAVAKKLSDQKYELFNKQRQLTEKEADNAETLQALEAQIDKLSKK